MSQLITIIIPAKNEEKRITPTLERYISYFEKQYQGRYEIIVVLNGCTDSTLEIVQRFAKLFPAVKIENVPQAIGKGGAIVRGFELAQSEFVCYTDADMSTRPEIMDRLLKVISVLPDVEAVIGSRELHNSIVTGKSAKRRIMSKGFNIGVNLLFQLGIKDTQCGAKIVRRSILPYILPYLTITDFAFDVNLLVDIRRIKGDIIEIPIEWEDSANSTITRPFKTSIKMALSVLKLRGAYLFDLFDHARKNAVHSRREEIRTRINDTVYSTN